MEKAKISSRKYRGVDQPEYCCLFGIFLAVVVSENHQKYIIQNQSCEIDPVDCRVILMNSVYRPEYCISYRTEENEGGELFVGEVASDQAAQLLDWSKEEEKREGVAQVAENIRGVQ